MTPYNSSDLPTWARAEGALATTGARESALNHSKLEFSPTGSMTSFRAARAATHTLGRKTMAEIIGAGSNSPNKYRGDKIAGADDSDDTVYGLDGNEVSA